MLWTVIAIPVTLASKIMINKYDMAHLLFEIRHWKTENQSLF